jgi:hypothetical protein
VSSQVVPFWRVVLPFEQLAAALRLKPVMSTLPSLARSVAWMGVTYQPPEGLPVGNVPVLSRSRATAPQFVAMRKIVLSPVTVTSSKRPTPP